MKALTKYFQESRKLLPGVITGIPLLIIYELGIFLAHSDVRNAADAYLRGFFLYFGPIGLAIWLGLLCACLLLAFYLAYREQLPAHRYFFPIVGEGLLFAFLFGPFVLFLQAKLQVSQNWFQATYVATGMNNHSDFQNVIFAVGAGVYEEVLFRLILLSLLFYLARRLCEFFSLPSIIAIAFAILTSALAFSAFHHIGELALPFSWDAFLFRTLAGVVLGGLFLARGFGVAVYTHAFYDILYLYSQ